MKLIRFLADFIGWKEDGQIWAIMRITMLVLAVYVLVAALAVGIPEAIREYPYCFGPPPGTPYNGPGPGP